MSGCRPVSAVAALAVLAVTVSGLGFGGSSATTTSPGMPGPAAKTAAGLGLQGVGTVLIVIPHPAATVAGAVLILAGTSLQVWAVLENGDRVDVSEQLTTEQKEKVRQGAKVEVKGSDGQSKIVEPERK